MLFGIILAIGDVMRKFIVSDLHGDGIIYDIIMNYLDDISSCEDVILYINGDLIDRGPDSFRMVNDVIDRIDGYGNVKIEYLAGNHELMFYRAYLKMLNNGLFSKFSDWYLNGGKELGKIIENSPIDVGDRIFKHISNLKIYHKFPEKILDNNILLVHAKAPKVIKDDCDITISNNNRVVHKALWTRKDDRSIFPPKIGKEGYLTIIGHTPVFNDFGFYYDMGENYLNIDGGCSYYVFGNKKCDHVPLIEVLDYSLLIKVFEHDGDSSLYSFDGKVKIK